MIAKINHLILTQKDNCTFMRNCQITFESSKFSDKLQKLSIPNFESEHFTSNESYQILFCNIRNSCYVWRVNQFKVPMAVEFQRIELELNIYRS